MKNIMLDIETMGSQSYSAITSIGAVKFDLNTGEIGDKFHVNINLQSSIDLGLIVNSSTILWWMQQNNEARSEFISSKKVNILEALNEFSIFCTKDFDIWGNSARFDCGILQNAYNKANINIPWDFRKERCLRTLVSFAPEIKNNYKKIGILHNALDDCINQIGYCCEIWNKLNH